MNVLGTLAFLDAFFILPAWCGYEGENMVMWAVGALILMLPFAALYIGGKNLNDKK